MDFKKIGRQVHFIAATKSSSRIGEGSFVCLDDGKILFGFTEFISSGREDEDIAQISAIVSADEGETWSQPHTLFEKPENALNIMSISFLNMANGDIGAFYIIKHVDGTDEIVLTRSADNGKTWSVPISCTQNVLDDDYYVINNDRAVMIRNGRIILPIARHSIHMQSDDFSAGELCFVYSDDDGKTWKKASDTIKCPFPNDKTGLQEPGIFEMDDGTLWCYIRTGLGFQYQSYSTDLGMTWSAPEPNIFFSSPCSPMHVKKCGDLTIAIFNPIPEHVLRDDEKEFWGRTPYVLAVSKDNGKTFLQNDLYYLEDDLNNGYCYPAVLDCGNCFLVAYYHSNNTDCCLNSTKIMKIDYNEIS